MEKDNTALKVLGVVGLIALAGLVLTFICAGSILLAVLLRSSEPRIGSGAQGDGGGIIVTYVEPGGPAAEAGLERGDILLEMDGRQVASLEEVQKILTGMEPGDELTLLVLHGDDQRQLEVELGRSGEKANLGIKACCGERDGKPAAELEPGSLRSPGRSPDDFTGVIVMEVVPESPAEIAGLLPGDVIFNLDGVRIDAEFDFAQAIGDLQPGDRVLLGVRRAGQAESLELSVRLGENPDEPEKAYLGVFYRRLPGLGFQGFFEGGPEGERDPRFFFREGPFPDREGGAPPFFFQLPHGIPFQGFPGPEGGFRRFIHAPGRPGALISEVVQGSPADQAGLSAGDLILELEGEEVRGFEGLVEALGEYEPEDKITLTVLRGMGDRQQVPVILGEHPDDPARAYLGVSIAQSMPLETEDGAGDFHFGPFHFDFDFEEFSEQFKFEELFPGGEDA